MGQRVDSSVDSCIGSGVVLALGQSTHGPKGYKPGFKGAVGGLHGTAWRVHTVAHMHLRPCVCSLRPVHLETRGLRQQGHRLQL